VRLTERVMNLKKPLLLLVVWAWCFLSYLGAQPTAKNVGGKRIQCTLEFTIRAAPDSRGLSLTALVPKDIDGRQKVVGLKYSHKPSKVFDEMGNRYAQFFFDKLARTTVVKIDADLELSGFDFARHTKLAPRRESKKALQPYLIHEQYLEKDAKEIQAAARKIQGKDDVEVVRNIMAYVTSTLKRAPYDPKDHGAVWALAQKKGDCTEFADLFVALCRAKGIPARVCEGYLIYNLQRLDTPKHNWAEVYTDRYGWLPLDPFHIHLKLATFEHKRPYVYLSTVRRDDRLAGFHFWTSEYEKGDVSVKDSFAIHKQTDLPRK
jgi:transglutaminase-like putative cysteine protease